LHRHAEGLVQVVAGDLDLFQVAKQGGAVVPGGPTTRFNDIVAAQGREWDARDLLEAESGGELFVFFADCVEAAGGKIDQVHLVDRQHHLADADQRDQVTVAPGLGQHPFAGIDEDHRHLGGGGAGDHVAGVLLVAGSVGDDELALVGGEEAVGDVDGDPLFALGLQPVEQQRIVDLTPLGADLFAVALQGGELILEDHLRVPEQTPDQGALAVVDAAAGDEAQQRLLLLGLQVGMDVLGDQC